MVQLPTNPLRRSRQAARFRDLLAMRPALRPRLTMRTAAQTKKNSKTIAAFGLRGAAAQSQLCPLVGTAPATPSILWPPRITAPRPFGATQNGCVTLPSGEGPISKIDHPPTALEMGSSPMVGRLSTHRFWP